MNKTRIGIIGCGTRCTDIFHHIADAVELVAISDPKEHCRLAFSERYPGDYTTYENHEALLAQSDCEWVIIATPNYMHKEHSIAAMQAGKHVFCEKPLATTIEDCFAIAEVQQSCGVQFFTDLPLRFAPLHSKIKSLIDDGAVGDIISFDFNECIALDHGGHIVTNDWRRFSELSGGHIVEKCCHDLDVANWFINSLPKKVASFGGLNCFIPENEQLATDIGEHDDGTPAYKDMKGLNGTDLSPFTSDKTVIDNQVAIIEYQNGVRASFHTNLHSAEPQRRFHIIGSKGVIQGEMYNSTLSYTAIGHHAKTEHFTLDAEGSHGGADIILMRNFLQCMQNAEEPISNLYACLCGTITALSVQQAMETGQIIDLTPIWERLQVMQNNHALSV